MPKKAAKISVGEADIAKLRDRASTDLAVARRNGGAVKVRRNGRTKTVKAPPPKPTANELIAKRFKFTERVLVQAIIKCDGSLIEVARRFKIPRTTLLRYVENNKLCQMALDDAREGMGDEAETKLRQLIREGDVRCLLYYLSTVHRHRGYGLNASDSPGGGSSPTFVADITIIGVPSGTFLPPGDTGTKLIDNEPPQE